MHEENASIPILTIFFGIIIDSNEEHFLNAEYPISLIVEEKEIDFNVLKDLFGQAQNENSYNILIVTVFYLYGTEFRRLVLKEE